jgi:hypothetical protein
MNISTRSFAAIAALTLTTTACDRAPLEPAENSSAPQFSNGAERSVDQALYDISGSFFVFACTDDGEVLPIDQGELVEMQGQIFERVTLMQDGAGGYHFLYHTMPVGLRGTGVTSGEEFRVIERDHGVANQRYDGNVGRYKQVFKMVGRDTGRTFWYVLSGTYLIGQDGTVKRSRDTETVQCKA